MKGHPALTFVVIFSVGLLLGLAFKSFFFSDSQTIDSAVESSTGKTKEEFLNDADIVAEDIELVQGSQGAMEWRLIAQSAKYNQEKKLVGVERPQLMAYWGADRKEVYVKSDRGDVDQINDNLTLYKNVTGRFGDIELIAQHLDYLGAMNKIYLKGGVTVKRPDMTLEAAAVEIDLISRELTAAGGVVALLAPKELDNIPFKQ